METKKEITCHICGSNNLHFFEKFQKFFRVTSDCKSWKKKGFLAICENCQTVQNKIDAKWKSEIKEIYNNYKIYYQSEGIEQKVFDKNGESFSRSEKLLKEIKQHLKIGEKGTLLDFGCGNGQFLRTFNKAYPNWKLSGHEFGNKYKETVKKINNVENFYTCNIKEIQKKFDLIIMLHVLEHIDDPIKFLSLLKEKLSDDGIMIIEVPNFLKNPFDLLIADHATHFSSTTLLNLLKKSGFTPLFFSDNSIEKELTLLVKKDKETQKKDDETKEKEISASDIVQNHLDWLEKLKEKGKKMTEKGNIGLFGTSIAAIWIFTELEGKIGFFVDEDNSRIGKKYKNIKILSPKDVANTNLKKQEILMPFMAAIGNKIKKRLESLGLNLVILDDEK